MSDNWQSKGLCRQVDPDLWYPEVGGNQAQEAKKICRSCDVRQQCLQYALDHDEVFGIWGGLSERERRSFKRGTYGKCRGGHDTTILGLDARGRCVACNREYYARDNARRRGAA